MPKYSVLKCAKCGYKPNILTDTCIQCRSEMKKICAFCGKANDFREEKCERCKKDLVVMPDNRESDPDEKEGASRPPVKERETGKISIEIQPIESTISGEDSPEKSARRSSRKLVRDDKEILKDLKIQSDNDDLRQARYFKKSPPPARPPKKKGKFLWRAVSTILALVLFTLLYLIAMPYIPRVKLIITAKKYLSLLSRENYKEAYKLLSNNSKASCALETFVRDSEEYYRDRPAWKFKDVEVFKMRESAALIKYKLKEGGNPWKDDIISFVNEHGSWRRPYIWNLFAPIEGALAKKDYSQALFLAQKLALTDPLDPRSWGYLCNAEYSLGLYEKSVNSCRKTLETEKFYPVGFGEESRRWYYFQYANSLKFTQAYDKAFNIYNMLLGDKNSGVFEKCQILISRADCYAQKKDYIEALKDIILSKSLCGKEFQRDIDTFYRILRGDAGGDAVNFAKKSRFDPDSPSLAALREEDAAKARRRRVTLTDKWIVKHIGGPEYRVYLLEKSYDRNTGKSGKRYVYVLKVNLWTQNVLLEREAD